MALRRVSNRRAVLAGKRGTAFGVLDHGVLMTMVLLLAVSSQGWGLTLALLNGPVPHCCMAGIQTLVS